MPWGYALAGATQEKVRTAELTLSRRRGEATPMPYVELDLPVVLLSADMLGDVAGRTWRVNEMAGPSLNESHCGLTCATRSWQSPNAML
jgi:hypothetical protein